MADLEALEAAREQAWRDYDTIARALPDCEHNRAWQEQIAAAARKRQEAVREYDRALAAQATTAAEARPEPASPSLPEDASHQEPLFGIEAA